MGTNSIEAPRSPPGTDIEPAGACAVQRAGSFAVACFVNGLRSKLGAFEFGARTVSYFIHGLMGLGLAFGAGGIAYGLASDREWDYMPAVFWFVLFTWQVVPVMLASFQEQFNLGTLLRFPVVSAHSIFSMLFLGCRMCRRLSVRSAARGFSPASRLCGPIFSVSRCWF